MRHPLGRRILASVLIRSLLVQGSWNYRTLIGTGFAFLLLPALRSLYRDDPEGLRTAVARHSEVFNSHPYLVTVAAGAVARLEAEGVTPDLVRRFKNALRGSLGSIGDQLVWAAWRPACALFAIALLLVGVPWWAGLLAFLTVYNALHLWLRAWGLRMGLVQGLEVGATLRSPIFGRIGERASDAGAFLAGFCAALAFAMFASGPGEAGVTAVAIVVGVVLGPRVRYGVWIGLALLWIGGMVAAALL